MAARSPTLSPYIVVYWLCCWSWATTSSGPVVVVSAWMGAVTVTAPSSSSLSLDVVSQTPRSISSSTALRSLRRNNDAIDSPTLLSDRSSDNGDCCHTAESRPPPRAPGQSSQSRRTWFQGLAQHGAALISATALVEWPSRPALAVLPPVVSSAAVCDPTVTVWQRDNNRLLYLLGTAHISELSADLAGALVREVHPNAVFVELDLKRVGRLPPPSTSAPNTRDADADNAPPPRVTKVVVPTFVSPAQSEAPRSLAMATTTAGPTTSITAKDNSMSAPGLASSISSSSSAVTLAVPFSPSSALISTDDNDNNAPPQQQPSPRRRDNWFQRQAMDLATATVGNALKGMYANLGNAGFKPGEEFASAIRAGQEIGATIVLGDRDVELTLRRLTQALAVTDFNKLLNPNADFERALADLGGGGGPSVLEPMRQDFDNPAEFKQALSAYVEKLKDRRSIANVMSQLNEVAPALVQVMLTERDAYMATGIDTLNDYECMVAVMGLAHQDGIERNLRQYGWKQVRPVCR